MGTPGGAARVGWLCGGGGGVLGAVGRASGSRPQVRRAGESSPQLGRAGGVLRAGAAGLGRCAGGRGSASERWCGPRGPVRVGRPGEPSTGEGARGRFRGPGVGWRSSREACPRAPGGWGANAEVSGAIPAWGARAAPPAGERLVNVRARAGWSVPGRCCTARCTACADRCTGCAVAAARGGVAVAAEGLRGGCGTGFEEEPREGFTVGLVAARLARGWWASRRAGGRPPLSRRAQRTGG
ncbi:hypothetical protein FHX46_004796 [Amycolatopsis viridis]|uniref:Uncharacterized protein n=1 Tax=Amycolatopsis viridis TaxID=185678 RepID=A0ABX0T3X5_9PSEU|nr:hypothetical protein [Amycolatopsis viridis]